MAGGHGFERGLQIGVGVHAVHLGRFNETGYAGPGRPAFVMAGEQCILATQGQRPDGVFDDIIPEPGLFWNRCLRSRPSLRCRVQNA